ncbi:MAG: hypothetical protein J7M08_05330 [Planctomycetes bacterium]|nr:hypothetical protein [Planctomycetota bacterium]
MAKKAKKKPALDRRLLRVGTWTLVLAALCVACWMGARSAWRAIMKQPQFRLQLHALELNDCPQWVRCSPMNQQLQKQLLGLPPDASIFRRDIAQALARELLACPWLLDVQEVRRVLPNSLRVRAVFRKPAALAQWNEREYLVDKDGHWLPDELFKRPKEWEGATGPTIIDGLLREPPPMTDRWDGPRMAVGARLSDFLRRNGLLRELSIQTIDVTGVGRQSAEPEIALRTADGVLIKWGKSDAFFAVQGLDPGPPRLSDNEKLQMLLSKLAERPRLAGISYLDLRYHGELVFAETNP